MISGHLLLKAIVPYCLLNVKTFLMGNWSGILVFLVTVFAMVIRSDQYLEFNHIILQDKNNKLRAELLKQANNIILMAVLIYYFLFILKMYFKMGLLAQMI